MKKSHLLLLVLPYALMFVGAMMNQAALHANGHLMPVLLPGHASAFAAEDMNHTVMTHTTHLKFLCDWMVSNDGVSSLGDYMQSLANDVKVPSLVAWLALTVRDVVVLLRG